jgi:hypothetical protein
MSTNKISGTMLKDNLLRDGVDLSFDGNLLYLDVANGRIGINTNAPAVELEVAGSLIAGDMQIVGNQILVGNPAGLVINSGLADVSVEMSKITNCEDPDDPTDVVNLRTLQDEIGNVSTNSIGQGTSSVTVLDNGVFASIEFDVKGTNVANVSDNNFQILTPLSVSDSVSGTEGQFGNITLIGNELSTSTGNLVIDSLTSIVEINASTIIQNTSPYEVVFTNALGEIITSSAFAFDGSLLTLTGDADITGAVTVTGSADIDGINIDGNTITSDASLDLTTTADGDITLNPGDGVVVINATSALQIPVGVQGERPATPAAGMIRFNTLIGEAEIYDGVEWSGFTADFVEFTVETFNGDGINDTFTLTTDPVSASSMLVDINGVVQKPLVAYTLNTVTNEITLTDIPEIGDVITVRQLANITDVRSVADEIGTTRFACESGEAKVIVDNIEQLVFDGTTADISTTLRPISDLAHNLGDGTHRFNNLHVNLINGNPADVAENFVSDYPYEPGTVVILGGNEEVTACTSFADTAVAGVVSTEPAYLLNSYAKNAVPVGLVGRVPCKVVGPIRRGELLVTSAIAGHATSAGLNVNPGTIIGKAMESFTGDRGVIMVLLALS